MRCVDNRMSPSPVQLYLFHAIDLIMYHDYDVLLDYLYMLLINKIIIFNTKWMNDTNILLIINHIY